MKTWKSAAGVVAVGLIAFAAGRSFPASDAALAAQPEKKAAQPEKKADDKKGGQPEMMMPEAKPGPEHEVLKAMVGDWEGGVKIFPGPGAPAMENKGTIHREMTMDGMYVIEHVSGSPMMPGGKPFKGMGIVGYNQIEKRYESVWIENMSSWMMFETGKYDAAKKTMTFEGDVLDPMTNKRVHHRSVADLSNPDRQTFASYGPGPDGKEFKNFEGTFERKKK